MLRWVVCWEFESVEKWVVWSVASRASKTVGVRVELWAVVLAGVTVVQLVDEMAVLLVSWSVVLLADPLVVKRDEKRAERTVAPSDVTMVGPSVVPLGKTTVDQLGATMADHLVVP